MIPNKEAHPSVHAPRPPAFPLSAGQEGLWFLHRLAPTSPSYNVPYAARLTGPVNRSTLKSALNTLMAGDDNLRIRFRVEDGEPVQYIHPSPCFSFRDCPAEETGEQAFREEVARRVGQPFDLEADPLIRCYLFRRSKEEHYLLMVIPHILVDGISIHRLFLDLTALYRLLEQRGAGRSLPLCKHSYGAFVQWQKEEILNKKGPELRSFWCSRLSGEPPSAGFPADTPKREGQSLKAPTCRVITRQVPALLEEKILKAGHACGFKTSAVLLSAYYLLLSIYSDQKDLLVGMPVSGRSNPLFSKVQGHFVNLTPLRQEVDPDWPAGSFIARVQQTLEEAVSHSDYPFSEIIKDLKRSGDKAFFNTLFAFHNYFKRTGRHHADPPGTGLKFTPDYTVRQTGEADVVLEVLELPEGLVVNLKYDRDLYYKGTAQQLLSHYLNLLCSLISHVDRPLRELTILSEKERKRLLYRWNRTDTPFRDRALVHELFEEQAAARPADTAISFYGQHISYRELNGRANALAHGLRARGMKRQERVALILGRSVQMVQGLLGVLKAGGAYVPLEPFLPPERIGHILRTLSIRFILTDTEGLETLDRVAGTPDGLSCLKSLEFLFTLDSPGPRAREWKKREVTHVPAREIAACSRENPERINDAGDLAYIIFTSGSTGTPKGVMVKHRPVVNLIQWVNTTFEVGPSDRLLFITSIGFDLSVYDILGVLAAGGRLCMVTSEDARNPQVLLDCILTEGITFWDSAPAALQLLVPHMEQMGDRLEKSRLRLVFLSGDYIPVTLPDQIRNRFKDARVISLGGATEATVWSNVYPIQKVNPCWNTIPYGKPIQNARYYVLNRDLNPVPIGVPGDLYIGGDCLSSGYVNDEEQTARVFLENPHLPGETIYKTGDRARWRRDGNLEFLGRSDFQVKIRGFRVEPGEIEAVLAKMPGIKGSVVIPMGLGKAGACLCAYYLSRQEIDRPELAAFLGRFLPSYMIPSFFIRLDKLPVTANGKLDRKALPAPLPPDGPARDLPRTDMERKVAGLFRQVFGNDRRFGIYEGFFDIGGHSLLAVKLISLVNTTFKCSLTVADLFKAPTIHQLAATIGRTSRGKDPSPRLVRLNHGRHLRPLFLIHPGDGDITCFIELARRMDKGRPIYGIRAYGTNGHATPCANLKEMAARYAVEIRGIQPLGPYLLGGFCAGGSIAYEIARQLKQRAQETDLLLLMESLNPEAYGKFRDDTDLYLSFLRDFGGGWELMERYCNLRGLDPGDGLDGVRGDMRTLTHGSVISLFYQAARDAGLHPADTAQMDRLLKVYQGCVKGLADYTPEPYDGPVAVFKASHGFSGSLKHTPYREEAGAMGGLAARFDSDTCLGWDRVVTQSPQLHHIPGDHFTVMKPPNVTVLAEKVNQCLNAYN
ncbi:MAG: amino acid adenylation domain-containing protein [Desulfobacteraceae bacterium]|nr:amino acid adenylation domain-containing protein [Desulfobacteraceae bacterium]